ncbi:hypothetical protein [Vibrio harveyi]|uniref:hypothetical protein n=1 Tax=Vibrio harveyi TaxID=669 RepID=UPI003CF2977B
MKNKNVVQLTMEEMTIVSVIAGLRRGESKTNGRKDNHDFNGDGAWDIEIEGAAAEMAYCKLRGKYWSGSVNSFKNADCGENVQIRHTVLEKGSLIVRDEDLDSHFYVLVTGRAPLLKVCGWINGSDAKQEKFKRAPNGRVPAYFVPQSALNSFN